MTSPLMLLANWSRLSSELVVYGDRLCGDGDSLMVVSTEGAT